MKWTLENALPAGFVLAVAALCAAGFASYLSTQKFAEAGKTVAQSQEILRELESTLLAVKEMEARQLTVLASGSETIPPSPAEVSAINVKFGRLKELASGANGRLERVQELERYVAREVELLQQMRDSRDVSTLPSSEGEATWRTLSALASQIRTTAAAISGSEIEALKQHSETAKPRPASHPSRFSPWHRSPWAASVWPFTNSPATCKRGVVRWSNYSTVRSDTDC